MANLSPALIAQYAYNAGFRGPSLVEAVAVSMAESGGNVGAMGDVGLQDQTWGPSVGLWQIRSLHSNKNTGDVRDQTANLDPSKNAAAAYAISNGGRNFGAWSTYNNGDYHQYMGAANNVVAHITGYADPGINGQVPNDFDARKPGDFLNALSGNIDPNTVPNYPSAPTTSNNATPVPIQGPNGVITDAQKYIGVPYKWGGTDPSTGLDCSGFVQRVYKDLGVSLPRVAADQANQGTAVASLKDAQPGDLVAFALKGPNGGIDHIGIYAGNNKMIVAPHTGTTVQLEDVYTTPAAIRRISSNPATASTPQAAPTSGYDGRDPGNFLNAMNNLLSVGAPDPQTGTPETGPTMNTDNSNNFLSSLDSLLGSAA